LGNDQAIKGEAIKLARHSIGLRRNRIRKGMSRLSLGLSLQLDFGNWRLHGARLTYWVTSINRVAIESLSLYFGVGGLSEMPGHQSAKDFIRHI